MARRQFDKFRKPSAKYDSSAAPTPQLSTAIPEEATAVGETMSLGTRKNFWHWQLIWLIVLLTFGVTGAGALLWLLTMPPPPNCQQIRSSPLASEGERLYCVQQAANTGKLEDLLAALAFVQAWPPDHPLRERGQQLVGDWSKAILKLATNKIEAGDLQGALDIVAKIPKDSPARADVEAAVAGWQNNWDEGQKLYDKAQEALKVEDLQKASEYAQALFKLDNVFWGQKRFNELVDQIGQERQGWQRLREARSLAQEGTPEKLGEAITLANKIGEKLHSRVKAEAEISRWSRSLLAIANKRLQEKDINGALVAANLIPETSSLYAEAQDLIQLGQAQAVTWNQSINTPLPQHIFALLEGKAAASQIAPDRPLYKQAQAQIQELEKQFKDLVQLQMATAIAEIGQPFAFAVAIDQAQMIGANRPRRVHAQTLVAYWRKEILRIEDQSYLLAARQLSESGTVDGFNAAIAQARQVAPGRPRRIEAQTLIADWAKRIQIIEDQPLLNEAIALAKQGKLSEAVAKATQIKNGRALYEKAQANVSQWVNQLQIAQDRPILNQASNLAAQGSLTAAINLASQIGYGRALHGEAQGAIARWSAERDAIAAPPPTASPAQYEAPAQEAYAPPPQEQYAPPPQEQYAPPPQEQYAPPPQEEPYYPPSQPQEYSPPPQESYSPPAPSEQPAAPEPAPEPAPAEPPPSNEVAPAPAPDANLLPE